MVYETEIYKELLGITKEKCNFVNIPPCYLSNHCTSFETTREFVCSTICQIER